MEHEHLVFVGLTREERNKIQRALQMLRAKEIKERDAAIAKALEKEDAVEKTDALIRAIGRQNQ